jgi:hypothetical protein
MSATHFELVSDWHLAAPIERVYDALHDTQRWPEWWPYVRKVEPLRTGDIDGVGAVRRLTWGSRLPYGLSFCVEVVEARRPRVLRGRASGELVGEGLWELWTEGPAGTHARYTWRVELNRAWMRVLSPLMAPVFRWNHNGVMAAGEQGLRRYLQTERA